MPVKLTQVYEKVIFMTVYQKRRILREGFSLIRHSTINQAEQFKAQRAKGIVNEHKLLYVKIMLIIFFIWTLPKADPGIRIWCREFIWEMIPGSRI